MTTKKSTKRIALLTALVLITSLFIGGTIARYVTSTSSEDEARVAVWGINADGVTMDLFNATYELSDGTIVAQSNDGDNIIAPGTSKDSYFSIVNTDDNLAPEVMYELRINLDDSEIDPLILNNPSIQWRLDEGAYGTWEETKAQVLALSGHESGVKTYSPGELADEFKAGVTHTIGWQWIMDNNNDVMDTEMGNTAVNGDLKAKIKVSVTARQVDVDTTGLLNGNNSVYNINNPMPLTFRSVAPANELQKVIVNNEELTVNEDYTVESGSTIITLLKAFLDNLPKGNYTIKIVSEDITVNASFTVAELPVEHSGTIPVGGTYYVGVETINDYGDSTDTGDYTGYTKKYVAGDKFPTPQIGDVYVYGDYEYRYDMSFTFDDENYSNSYWYETRGEYSTNGWGVRVLDTTKTTYEEIIPEINNKPITDLNMTFTNCTNLIESPEIPSTVVRMEHTYVNCTNLKIAKDIPDTVTLAEYLFYNCPALEEAPKLSNNVKDYDSAFYGCSSLTKMPEIPNGVEKIGNMFENCTSLVETTTIPNSVNMMSYTFQNCTSLETAPVIPESVDYLYATFNGCSNLTGTIEINSTPFSYPNALKGTQITEITGACSDARKEQILATR